MIGKGERRRPRRPARRHDVHHVWDHVAGALDQHRVADPNVLAPDLVLVVEADVADDHTGQLDGIELSARREDPGLADLHADRPDDGGRLARGEFERDRPARVVSRLAEPPLELERVDFHDRAVRLVRERVALGLEAAAVVDHGVDVGAACGPVARRASALPERLEHLPVPGDA